MRGASTVALLNAAVLVGAALAAAGADRPAPLSAPAAAPAPPSPAASPPASPLPTARPRPAAPAPVRATTATGYRPYAAVGPVVLHLPAARVEAVGLHESGHDGAQPQQPLGLPGLRLGALDSRERGTNGQGAADVVVDPSAEVRAPVTGTVLRAGTYTLYCDHVDEYLVVEPDARPGWEVKLLHFTGLSVRPGDRVRAGVTKVGRSARVLPFVSQVDRHTVAPHWPHLHLEVVDPSVPDRPGDSRCD